MKTIIHRFFLTDHLFNSKVTDSTSEVIKQALVDGESAKTIKRGTLLVGIALAIITSLLMTSCSPAPKEETKTLSQEALIARGKYLTTVGSCNDCHTPKIMTPHGPIVDTTRILSGHPQNDPIPPAVQTQDWVMFGNDFTSAVGPWGMTFSANLTPDDTGIGSWSFEQFETAIRKGKYKGLEGSRDLLPPMPWEMYRNYTDEDLRAVFAYLKSLKPINNLVPSPIAPGDLTFAGN
ncbi:MAG: c-type cytochrome [Cyclobacteriaceae bacterium]